TADFEYFVQQIAGVYGVSADEVKVTNWSKGHIFESDLHKLFNQNRIIAYIIQVIEENSGLDLLLSYK
ncbi:27874_t:CDS:2, partial [Racocetra persica]